MRSVEPLWLLLGVNATQAWRRLCALRTQSRLLIGVIAVFIAGYWAVAFWLFYRGLRFIGAFPGLGTLLTERLLYLLFAFLFGLLLLSNLIISYTNLFRNRETQFLLTQPVSLRTIYRWKILESTLLASWAFVFLVAPLLAAYGLTARVAWHFYPMTLLLIGMFIVLPGVCGAWLAVLVARYFDRRGFQLALLAALAVLVAGAGLWLRPEPVTDESLETRVLAVVDRLLLKTRFAEFPALPSYWLSASVLHWSEGATSAAVFFLLMLASYALFFGSAACATSGRAFYEAASAVQSRGSGLWCWPWARRAGARAAGAARLGGGVLEWLSARAGWVRADVRALALKDIRSFWRDTTQWAQTILLFGLLGVYILNLRHFSQQTSSPFWAYLISFLNLGACSLNLATLTTRFVYPQFSLEGKRLWIIGMAPLGLQRAIRTKFWLTVITAWVVTVGLMATSSHMLRLPWMRTLYLILGVTVMTFTLTALALGLGVLYPNFKEENPSKIVSGFGGTFCLVLSFLYILVSVVLLATGAPRPRSGGLLRSTLPCWAGFLVLSAALGWVPLRLAFRKLRSVEL